MGIRGSLSPRQLTSPHPVQGLRRDGNPWRKAREATVRKNMQHLKEPGTRRQHQQRRAVLAQLAAPPRSPVLTSRPVRSTQMPQPLWSRLQLTWGGDDTLQGPPPNTCSVAVLPPVPEIEGRARPAVSARAGAPDTGGCRCHSAAALPPRARMRESPGRAGPCPRAGQVAWPGPGMRTCRGGSAGAGTRVPGCLHDKSADGNHDRLRGSGAAGVLLERAAGPGDDRGARRRCRMGHRRLTSG